MSLSQYSKEEIKEMSLLELAYEFLVSQKQAVPFSEIVQELKRLQDLSDAELTNKLSQFYTDLNVDGRFTSIGENRWGLKAWYPVDQIEDEVLPAAKPKKKKAKKADDEELEDFDEVEEEDLDYDDLDDFEEEEEDLVEDDDDLLDDDDDDDAEEEDLEEALEEGGFIIDDEDADLDEEDEDEDEGLEDETEDDDKL
ncbi:DNA-directed RNA polymerase subunit delta [Peribacillus deserti]|uniref:Probable DNA-directed RNA polymerase subunit delta n=1 Tax=Peribacillus deserti TaxID=673318 RepID=A0A2N5MBD9_9BACI|nr:DNA-directed RNA polymerase subunit delta [Peribacillus deserti]PLT31671.1 DNA-directed RNA polymerase subunit delta [Peribacillus deserti]